VSASNGLLDVAVDGATGTFSLNGVPGYGQLVDGGDLGDSYNYSPPGQDGFVSAPTGVEVSVVEAGPVRSKIAITSTYVWADHVDGASQARVGEHTVSVETVLELRADEPVLRVTTSFVNPSRDHRLRVHLPLPEAASVSVAECAFATVTRGLTAEGRSDEFGLPTAPARRFVYELIDIDDAGDAPTAHTMALTVLRSTGMLSRLGMAYRPFPAGPLTPVDGLQMTGRTVSFSYALVIGVADPYELADDVLVPLEVVGSVGGGSRAAEGSAFAISGAEVSALRREGGVLEVRVFNPRSEATTVSLPGHSGWLVDLRGFPQEHFEGSFPLRPFGIATARLRAD
jgi:mannosylglycerate hydrolase